MTSRTLSFLNILQLQKAKFQNHFVFNASSVSSFFVVDKSSTCLFSTLHWTNTEGEISVGVTYRGVKAVYR